MLNELLARASLYSHMYVVGYLSSPQVSFYVLESGV